MSVRAQVAIVGEVGEPLSVVGSIPAGVPTRIPAGVPNGHVIRVAPTRRRRRHLERTRADILEATMEVVSDFGYQGSRIEQICSRAGISRGAFYHHFPSKEAAIVALIERHLERLTGEVRRIIDATANDRVRMLALEMAAIMRWVGSGDGIARAYFVEMMGVPEAEALRERIELDFDDHLRTTLEPLFASGELVSTDVATTFRAFAGMTKETGAAWARSRVSDLAAAIREVVRLGLFGVGVDPQRAAALAEEAACYQPAW